MGLANVREFKFGRFTHTDVPVLVVNAGSVFAPSDGVIGLPIFSELGISMSGVPTDFPDRVLPAEELNMVDDPTSYVRSRWLEEHQCPKPERDVLLAAIKPYLEANPNIRPGQFCSHPSAVVSIETGDALPIYTPQYRLTDFMAGHVDRQIALWEQEGIVQDAPLDSR